MYTDSSLNRRCGLGDSYLEFGFICKEIGDFNIANKYVEKCRDIASTLINEYPDNLRCLILQCTSASRLSALHCFSGALCKAKELAEESLQICQYLIKKDKTNRIW